MLKVEIAIGGVLVEAGEPRLHAGVELDIGSMLPKDFSGDWNTLIPCKLEHLVHVNQDLIAIMRLGKRPHLLPEIIFVDVVLWQKAVFLNVAGGQCSIKIVDNSRLVGLGDGGIGIH